MSKRKRDRTLDCLRDPGCWPGGVYLPLQRRVKKKVVETARVFMDDPCHVFFEDMMVGSATASVLYDHVEDIVKDGWEAVD